MQLLNKKIAKTKWLKLGLFVSGMFLFCVGSALAADSAAAAKGSIGDVAGTITTSFSNIGKLMVAIAYVAGFGFTIAAIFKFKQHKDNPTQIPMGTPIALLVVGIALVFVPAVINMGGSTTGLNVAGGFTGAGADSITGSPNSSAK